MAKCFSCYKEFHDNDEKEVIGMLLCDECIDRNYEQCEEYGVRCTYALSEQIREQRPVKSVKKKFQ